MSTPGRPATSGPLTPLYAVMGQLMLSASNYAVFVVFARELDPSQFVSFSTAVGLNMLAMAFAEGGISFVAPRELATDKHGGSLGGALVALSVTLHALTTVGAYALWNALSSEQLDARWVASYAAFVMPTLLIPSWVTCWSLNVTGLVAIGIARSLIVVGAVLFPGTGVLAVSGVAFLGFSAWLLATLNRYDPIVTRPTVASIRTAVDLLRHVFVARTLSYVVYALGPLIVGVTRGSAEAAQFVTGERLKGLYATLFQPVLHTGYLARVRTKARDVGWGRLVHGANALLAILSLIAIHLGALAVLGDRFAAVSSVDVYFLAAFLSVAAGAILHLSVLPNGDLAAFRRATTAQMIAFGLTYAYVALVPTVAPAWILAVAEGVLLTALLAFRSPSRDSR